MYTNTTQYLRSLASDLVHGCRRTAADGTVIYTPDGTASYDGLWLRDFSYMVEYAGFAIPDQDIVKLHPLCSPSPPAPTDGCQTA